MKNKIWIIGGYGAVGRKIAKNLAALYHDRIIIAGRNLTKAENLAKKIGAGIIPKEFDLDTFEDDTILQEAQLVIVCLDSTHTKLVEACIRNGITYIDITAQFENIKQIEAFDQQAKANQTTIVLSVGLAPGMTNLLAKLAKEKLPKSSSIDIYILLGLAEKHGEQAYRWTFNNIDSTYRIKNKTIKSFSSPKKTVLLRNRSFYTFDFSDQHVLSRIYPETTIRTRMAFDLCWVTKITALLRTTGITKFLKTKKVQDLLIQSFQKLAIGTDCFALKIEAQTRKGQSISYIFQGNNEGKITAAFTTEMAIKLLTQKQHHYGVKHSHDIIGDIPNFIEQVKKHDVHFAFQQEITMHK